MMVAERQLRQSLRNSLYLPKTVPSVLCRCQLQFPLKFTFSQKRTIYSPSTISAPFLIADGRVAKTPWHLLVRESQPMHSTSTNKTIQQAFIYRKMAVIFLSPL